MDIARLPFRPQSRALALEPRILFDGAAAAAVEQQTTAAVAEPAAVDASHEAAVRPAPQSEIDASPSAASSADGNPPPALLIIDGRLNGYDSLMSGLPDHVVVRVVGAQESGIEAISEALAALGQVQSVQILSHGSAGQFVLGSDTINPDSLTGASGAQIQGWSGHLTATADILLYGCNTGAGAGGATLVARLAELTGADIAASTDNTGTAARGGDWVLERHSGSIESTLLLSTPALQNYDQLLAAPSVSNSAAAIAVIEPSTLNAVNADRTTLSGWTISDDGIGSANVTVDVKVGNTAHGTLSNPGGAMGGTVSAIAGGFRYIGAPGDAQAWVNQLVYSAADVELGSAAATDTLTVTVTDGETPTALSASKSIGIVITPSNDPVQVADATLAATEATSTVVTAASLAALDPEVTIGSQNTSQLVYRLTAMPANGHLTLAGNRIGVGSTFTQADVINNRLEYVHTATGASQNAADSFAISVNDGATPQANSDTAIVNITITPVNQAPKVSASGTIFEGQPSNATSGGVAQSVVGNFIVADAGGDPGDTITTVQITSLTSHGTLFFNGTALTAADVAGSGFVIAYADRGGLTYANDGDYAVAGKDQLSNDGFGITVVDNGGGTGSPASQSTSVTLRILPANDDPVFVPTSSLKATVSASYDVTLTQAMLRFTDVDSADTALTFVMTADPDAGVLLLNGKVLLPGATFTMQDVISGNVSYQQTGDGAVTAADAFNFQVRDNAISLLWDNATGAVSERAGGSYVANSNTLQTYTFNLTLTDSQPTSGPPADTIAPTPAPTQPTNPPAGETSTPTGYVGAKPGADAVSSLSEGGSVVILGNDGDAATPLMLNYGAAEVPASQVVYTLTAFGGVSGGWNGQLQKNVAGVWVGLSAYETFSQEDLNQGRVRFVHDGGEDFESTFSYQVSAGGLNGSAPAVTEGSFTLYITPINDAPAAAGSSHSFGPEGATLGITTAELRFTDADDAISESYLENDPAIADGVGINYALNNGVFGGNVLQFRITDLPDHGTLEYFNGSSWVALTASDVNSTLLDASLITGASGTTGLRYVHNGQEDRSDSFQVIAVDRWGADSVPATVTLTLYNINDGPSMAQNPTLADPSVPAEAPNLIGGTPVNDPLIVISEGSFAQITSSLLQAYDPDSTAQQVQYRITGTATQGRIAYSTDGITFTTIGIGSSFTQEQINNGYIYYIHDGTEPSGNSLPAAPDDKFTFSLADGDKEQNGNEFWIYVQPTNDAPVVSTPAGPINIDSSTGANNPVAGFSVDDLDLAAVSAQETDFLQVTVRLLSTNGTPFSAGDYAGVSIGVGASGATMDADKDGNADYLTLRGTRDEVNTALAGLTVTFSSDRDATYQVQVIADDRVRDAESGALLDRNNAAAGTQPGGNGGGTLNQPVIIGGKPSTVLGTEYDWYSADVLGSGDTAGNIAAGSVLIRASLSNDPPSLEVPLTTQTPYEDTAFTFNAAKGNNITIADAESSAFGLPVKLTLSVANGTLSAAASSGVTISGDGTGTLVLSGTADNIQNLLNTGGFSYTGKAQYNDSDTLTVTLDEDQAAIGGDTGSGSVKNPDVVKTVALDLIAVNDAASVTLPTTPVPIGTNNVTAIPGVSVTDARDFADGIQSGETDFIQVTVRLLDASGNPISDYSGIIFGRGVSAAVTDKNWDGNAEPLVLRGTVAEVNAALAGLTVAMTGDRDTTYRLQVLADDRLRLANGALIVEPSYANGGTVNQQGNLPVVPDTDNFASDPIGTPTATATSIYNITAATVNLFVSSSNDAPVNVMPSGLIVTEDSLNNPVRDTAGNFIRITDADDFGSNFTVVISLLGNPGKTGGTLSIADNAGVSGDNLSGQSTLTLVGNKTNLNAVLQTLTFTPTPNLHGALDIAKLRIVTTDTALAGSSGGNLSDTDELSITITPANDRPTASSDVTLPVFTEDIFTPDGAIISGMAFGYSDAVDDQSGFINEVTTTQGGKTSTDFSHLAIVGNAAIAAQGVWQVSIGASHNPNNPADWITVPASGLSPVSALIVSVNAQVRFVPAADFHGTPGSLSVRLADGSTIISDSASAADLRNLSTNGGAGTTGAWSASDRTIGTSVSNVNDRPSGANTVLANVNEDNAIPAGATIAALGFGYSDAIDNRSGIPGGGNAATALGGIAIVGNTADPATEGVWQYNDNAGSGWVTIASGEVPSDVAALLLPTTASLRFLPVSNYNGTPGGLDVRLSDTAIAFSGGADISGSLGIKSQWSNSVLLNTSVNPQNDAPVLTGTVSNPTAVENDQTGTGISVPDTALVTASSVTIGDLDLTTTAGLTSTVFGAGSITVILQDPTRTSPDYVAGDVLLIDLGKLTGGVLPAGVSIDATNTGVGKALTINLGTTTTLAQVQELVAAVTYKSSSDNPTDYGTNNDRHYRIVISDGNNRQGATTPNAGGPTALNSATLDGVLMITATNDPPNATNDANAIDENSLSISGNVKTGSGGTLDTDPDNTNDQLNVTGLRTGTEAAGGAMTAVAAGTTSANGTVITGAYGSLVLGADGSYLYNLDNNNATVNALKTGQTLTESFSYTLSDGALSDVAQITITINGTTDGIPSITPDDGNGSATGQATVNEAGLTSSSDNSETTSGSISLAAADGLASIAVEGNILNLSQLQALSPATPVTINTGEGTLTLTGFNASASVGGVPTAGRLSYTYTLKTALNQPGAAESTDSSALTLQDAGGASNSGTLTVRIVDDTPTANADVNSVNEGTGTAATTTGGNVFALGSAADVADRLGADIRANPVTAVSFGANSGSLGAPLAADYGRLTLNADGSYVYTLDNTNPLVNALNVGGTLTETFSYALTDADGDTSSATLTITIQGTNDAPVANGSLPNIAKDDSNTVTIPTAGGFTEVDTGDQLNYTVSGLPAGLSVDLNTGIISGTLDHSASQGGVGGVYAVTVTATDSHGASTTQSFNLTVTNPAPVARPDSGTVNENATLNVAASHGVIQSNANAASLDSDPDGDSLAVAGVAAGNVSGPLAGHVGSNVLGTYGHLTLNADGSYSYSADSAAADALAQGQTASDVFSYTVSDGEGGTSTTTLSITIHGQNDAPVAVDDTNSITEDAVPNTVSGNVTPGSVGQDRDADAGDTFSVSAFRTGTEVAGSGTAGVVGGSGLAGSYGHLVLNADGSYSYALDNANPAVNALKAGDPPLLDIFTYTISDSHGATDSAQLTISINGVSDGIPIITPIDGNGTTVGEVSVVEAGLTSGADNSETSTGVISLVAGDGLSSVTVGGRTLSLADLIALATTPISISTAAGTLTLTGFNVSASIGGVPINATLGYRYTLTAAQTTPGVSVSTEAIALAITDAGGDTSTGTLTVAILDDTPSASNDANEVNEGTTDAPTTTSGNVFANGSATDVADRIGADSTPNPVTSVSFNGNAQPVGTPFTTAYGLLVLNADGSYSYSVDNRNPTVNAKNVGDTLTETFNYVITDADGDTASAKLVITLRGTNDAPVAGNDSVRATGQGPLVINVLGNDSDVDDTVYNITAISGIPIAPGETVTLPSGTVTLNTDGTLTFTPGPAANGTVSFTYQLTDAHGGVSTATVTIDFNTTKPLPPYPMPLPEVLLSVKQLPIPFEAATFVTDAVQAAYNELISTDARTLGSDPRLLPGDGIESISIGAGLGFDPALFVQYAVRSSQSEGRVLGAIVATRHGVISLSSDGEIATPELFSISPNNLVPTLVTEAGVETSHVAEAVAPADGNAGLEASVGAASVFEPLASARLAAQSFSDQIRHAHAHVRLRPDSPRGAQTLRTPS